jgi:hypothetical protein
MKFLNDIQALQVSEDLSTEMALMLVDNVVKKRNLGNTYLKSVVLNLPNIFNPVTGTATPAANTLTYSLQNQTAKNFFAAPILSNGTPSFRPMTFADISDFYTAVDKSQLNYWTLSGANVYRSTGKVFVGSSGDYGLYNFQVTGDSYFAGGIMSSQGGTAALPKITLSGYTNTGIYTPAANSWGVSTNGVHALVVNASQFVGINNTNPLTRLHVTDSGAYHIRIERTGVGASLIGMSAQTSNSTGDMLFDMTQASQGYAFRTRNGANDILNSFSINRDGDVGIGTFIPLLTLDARVPSQYSRPSIGGVSADSTRWGYSLNPINASTSYDLVRSSNIGFRIAKETALGGGTFTTELSINTSGYVGIGINTITGSAGAYYLQVGGDIYGSTLTGSTVLLKTVNGVITRAVDGTDYYSPATISNANYWTLLSGNVYRATGYVGIGISNPESDLHLYSVAPILSVTSNNGGSGLRINILGSTAIAYRTQVNGVTIFQQDVSGSVGIAATSLLGVGFKNSRAITGGSSGYSYANISDGVIQSDVTGAAWYYRTQASTQSASFTMPSLLHFHAAQGTIGVGSSITTQAAFYADASLIGAFLNYGFWGNIASGANRWNLYMSGTALNYLAGDTLIGSNATAGSYKLQVFGQSYFRNLTTNGEIARFIDITDGSFMAPHNWGIAFNRSTSYLRPTTNDDKTLVIGSSDANLRWSNLYLGTVTLILPNYLNYKLLKTNTGGVLVEATATDVVALLGTGYYIQNQNTVTQSAVFWISGNGSAGSFTAKSSTPSTGNVSLIAGNITNSGYLEIRNTANLRLGYIGFSAVDLTYVAENSANHVFVGGEVIIGSSTVSGTKVLQVNGGIRQNDVISGLLYANAQGEFTTATAVNIAATLGAGNYIQNQYTAAQGANAWISGTFRSDNVIISSRKGYFGTYVGTEVQGLWSIGAAYLIDTTANNFGYHYGLVYSHTNAGTALPDGSTIKNAITGWGHQILFTNNGIVTSGISLTLGSTWQLGQAVFGNYAATLYGSTSYSFISPSGVSYLANNLTLGKTGTGGILRFIRPTDGVDAAAIGFIDNSTLNITSYGGSGIISFTTSSTEKARITANGKFLIGTVSENSFKVRIDAGSAANDGLHINGHLTVTGNAIIEGYFQGTTSDRRLKSDFKTISVIDKIDHIGVYSYRHKNFTTGRLIGSVAQELQKFFPELITTDSNGFLRVNEYGYSALSFQLCKEIVAEMRERDLAIWQQTDKHTAEIAKLKTEVRKLKTKVRQLSKHTR